MLPAEERTSSLPDRTARMSRSMWMHLDRLLNSDPSNERYSSR